MSTPLPHRKLVMFRSGIPGEMLPLEPDCGSGVTCWRRLRDWQGAGTCDRLHRRLMDRLGAHDVIVWECASLHNGALDPHAPAAGASDSCSGTIILRATGEIIGGVGLWFGALAVHILWPVDYHRPSHFPGERCPIPGPCVRPVTDSGAQFGYALYSSSFRYSRFAQSESYS